MAQTLSNLTYSVSYTTRLPRPVEVHGRDYFFVSKGDFKEMARRGEFAEWAEVHGHLYGTHWGTLNRTLDEGIDVLLDVDAQGAALLKKTVSGGGFYIHPSALTRST